MALAALTTWIANQILTAAALNNELANIRNNALALISPLTGNLDAGGFRIITLSAGSVSDPTLRSTGDADTGIFFSAADTVDVAAGGNTAASLGASFLLAAAPQDSRTNTVDVLGELRSTTSGTPAAGIGTGLLFSAESADENPSNVGQLDFVFTDVTAASEDSVLDVNLRTAGAALGSRYRFQATGAFLATITHALTAARTITVPDITGTLALVAGGQAMTLTTPLISGAAPATPVANTLYADGFIKGWADINVSGGVPTLDTDVNVSSITDNGVGDFTVTWALGFATGNYAVVVSHNAGGGLGTFTPAAGSVRFTTLNDAGAATDPSGPISVIASGAQ